MSCDCAVTGMVSTAAVPGSLCALYSNSMKFNDSIFLPWINLLQGGRSSLCFFVERSAHKYHSGGLFSGGKGYRIPCQSCMQEIIIVAKRAETTHTQNSRDGPRRVRHGRDHFDTSTSQSGFSADAAVCFARRHSWGFFDCSGRKRDCI